MNSLTKRMFNYLKTQKEKWVQKNDLQDLAIEAGYNSTIIKDAFRALDGMVMIGNVWNKDTRQVEYRYYPMSQEEIAKKQADLDWFENL